jgi:hypothetical protein
MRSAIACGLLVTACASPAPPAVPQPSQTSRHAAFAPPASVATSPVLVVIVVDQLASWVLRAREPSLDPNGVFRRFMREGVYAPELRYEHATTSTAPGHAALFTGLPPRDSGIFANERLDEATNQPMSMFGDHSARLVLNEPLDATSSSPAVFRAPTLADALRAQRPDAQIVSLSLKDRAAIPGAGKQPDLALWFDPARESFVSSSAFTLALPEWVHRENAALAGELEGTWSPLDPAWLAQHAPTPDVQEGEGDFGLGVEFPYALARAKRRGLVFRGYPAADRALLSLARAALRDLPNDSAHDHPLLLSLSFSAFDYVGHVHGPDSWESWEVRRELDLALADFIDELEGRFGSRLGVLLSADHGTAPLPETTGTSARPWCGAGPDPFERPCEKGHRLYREQLELLLRQASQRALGPGEWIRGVVEPFVYFTAEAQGLPPARRDLLENAAAAALLTQPGISQVLATRRFSGPCPPPTDDGLLGLVCRSVPADAPELYIVVTPGSFFDPHLVHGHGINHGSPYLYDRSVPLLAWSAAEPRGRRWTQSVRPADFTATAAAMLGIAPPAGAASGHSLYQPK